MASFLAAQVAAAPDPATFTFEETKQGELPAGWVSEKTGEGPGSLWKVVAADRSGRQNHALAQVSSEGPRTFFNLCVQKDARHADVDLSVAVKAVKGEIDQGGGLLWRYKDSNNYYITRWNPLENNFRFYKVEAGKRTQLATADITLPADHWHTIRAEHLGSHIRCYLDGQLLLDVTDETFKQAGAIGLWSKADAVTWFDDLIVRQPSETR